MRPIIAFLLAFIFLIPVASTAQTPIWGFPLGSSGSDQSHVCKVAPNGNVCIGGRFTGTMDLDPGTGVHNVTSSGLDDIFLACYSPGGSFLWGFNIGGTNNDAAWTIAIDAFNNVIVCGYQQGGGIDFDPGPGIATIPFMGGTAAYYGDGFVAKYTSAGAFAWAKDLGGPTMYDVAVSLGTDPLGCVYVGGVFNTTMTVSASITFSSAAAGTAYLIKYDAAGNVKWGHNYGLPGISSVDCFPRSLTVSNGFIYVGGFYQATSNFNPWGTPVLLTSSGTYDAYVAKYDTAGNFVFVRNITGTGYNEEVGSLTVDASDNIYIAGYTTSPSLTFNTSSPGTSTVTAPGGGTGSTWDIFIAKYSSSGLYQWGKIVGGPGNDYGMSIDVNGDLYFSGYFNNTVDFDPSSSVANLTSAGLADIYLAKYDLSGNYLCAFRMGSAAYDDMGYGVSHDDSGHVYISGQFGGAAVDFDPTTAIFPLTAAGGTDAYLVKYNYAAGSPLAGFLVGDTICAGDTAFLKIVTTSGGAGPFTVAYSNGITTYTVTGVNSGVSFPVLPSPTVTTTYTVSSVLPAGASICTPPPSSSFGSATVLVNPTPGTITGNVPLCVGATITLSNSAAGGTWSISPISVATISPTGIVTAASAGSAIATYTTACGSVTALVTVNPLPGPIAGNAPMCLGSTISLSNASSGGIWSIAPATVATISATGVVTSISSGTATVTYTTPCGAVNAVVTVNVSSAAIGGNTPVCTGSTITLTGSPTGGTWTIAPAGVATVSATGVVTPVSMGTASVTYTTACGSVTAIVTVSTSPAAITGNAPICAGGSLVLSSATPGGTWNISPTSVATISPTGVVVGLSNGTATVSYTTLCSSASVVVTVSSIVGPITGSVPLCVGHVLTLSNASAGGTWSISPTSIATISASGTVTGIAAGTATVTYITSCGLVTAVVTVNAPPAAITGNAPFCIGGFLLLSSATPGGTWNISPVSVATISPTGVVTGLSNGTAIVSYTTSCGSVSIVVTVNSIVGAITGNAPLCVGHVLTLSVASAGGAWTISPTSIATISASGTVAGIAAGTAEVTYTTLCGAVYTTVTVNGTPTVSATADTPCEGGILDLSATAPAGATFNWTGPLGFSSVLPVVAINPVRIINAGTYFVTATVAGCTSTPFPVVVIIDPLPVITNVTSGNPTMCLAADGWLRLHGLIAGANYTVSYTYNGAPSTTTATADGAGSVLISSLAAGTYANITVTSSAGCTSSTVGPVIIRFPGITAPVISSNQPLCEGQTLYLLSSVTVPGGTFSWSYPDGGGSSLSDPSRPNVLMSASGIYTLTYTVDTCPVTATTNVTIYPNTVLYNVTRAQTIDLGESVQLNANGAIYYLWTGDASISDPFINNPVATPTVTTTYTVYGMNEGGCRDTATVTISVNDDENEFIPTAFTPNGDGLNDIFCLGGIKFQKLIEFSIYNRWGERVYYNGYSPKEGWDGTYKGVPQEIDVYNYYIRLERKGGEIKIYKGDVTLIR